MKDKEPQFASAPPPQEPHPVIDLFCGRCMGAWRMTFDYVDMAWKQPVYYCAGCANRVRVAALYYQPTPAPVAPAPISEEGGDER